MNREELYNKTVNVLLDAYNNNELRHGECNACAVGNICKEASELSGIRNSRWSPLFCTNVVVGKASQNRNGYKKRLGAAEDGMVVEFCDTMERDEAKRLISFTKYTIEELAKVEFAFEGSISTDIKESNRLRKIDIKEGQYIGLCAVLEVLKEIHEVDQEASEKDVERLTEIKDRKLQEV